MEVAQADSFMSSMLLICQRGYSDGKAPGSEGSP